MQKRPGQTTRKRRALIGWCAVVPVLLIVVSAWIYGFNNRPIHIVIPTPRVPDPNAYDDFVRAGNLARAMKHKSPYSMARPAFKFSDFEAAAKDAKPVVATLRQGFGHEYLNPPIRSYRANSFPIYASMREVARVEAATAMYHEMDGKPALATEARLDGLEMGTTMQRGGLMIAGLVGIACESIALSQFEPQLPLLSETELAHVAARLDRIAAKRVSFADILQEEGNYQAATTLEMLNDPKGYRNFDTLRDLLSDDVDPITGARKPLTLQQNWRAIHFLLADKSAIVRDNMAYNRALVAEARGPFRGPSKVQVPDNLLAQIGGGVFAQARERFAALEAVQSILQTEVALFRYKKAHGRFPAALIDLELSYLSVKTMADPFSNGLLRYQSMNDGKSYLLYSVGPDMKDDSGAPSRHVGVGPGDIVAFKMWPRKSFKK